MPGEKTCCNGLTFSASSAICLATEASFRWLRLLRWSRLAESNIPIPGNLGPLSFLKLSSSSEDGPSWALVVLAPVAPRLRLAL